VISETVSNRATLQHASIRDYDTRPLINKGASMTFPHAARSASYNDDMPREALHTDLHKFSNE
jgi:hypothetical protein